MIDKHDILSNLDTKTALELELGCGNRKRHPHAIGIDRLDYPGVDIVGDALEVLGRFADNSVAAVYSYHFFEHVVDVQPLMVQLDRIIAPGGRLRVVVPHFSNPYYYSDPTHRTPFGLYSFSYFCRNVPFKRQVPAYGPKLRFDLSAVKLIFKSARPFYGRYALKKPFEWLFNLNGYLLEFYEENLCYLIPCYEIRYQLVKRP